MSIPAAHSARISQHVYADPDDPVPFVEGAELKLDGRTYRILEISDKDPLTGYQGAIYQDQASGELIPAHRGTETSLITPLLKDGIVDAQMVLARANSQTPFAEALTQRAIEMQTNPEYFPQGVSGPLPISHTGHSLGGCHAQNEAAKHGHGGASFNAFGAVGIGFAPAGIVEGTPPFTSYVRATDAVAMSSRHFGDVVSYATAEDVAMVTALGTRPGVEGPLGFLRNVGTDALGRHSIDGFVEGGLMTDANRHRYLDHQPQFAEHSQAVHQGRESITYVGDVLRPGAAAAATDLLQAGPSVLASPIGPFANASREGAQAVMAAAQSTPAPPVFEPLQRSSGDAIRHALEARAGLTNAGADITTGSAKYTASINDLAEASGRGVQQSISALAGHASEATDTLGELGAAAHRRLGEASQRVADWQANALQAAGLDALAENVRARGVDGRTEAENTALNIERRAASTGDTVTTAARWATNATQTATDAVSSPLEALSAGHHANAERMRVEAQGLRNGAIIIPEALYGASAPNLDMRAAAREKIAGLYAQFDRPITDPQLDQLSAAVVASARESRMVRIDTVRFSQGINGPNFEGSLIAYDRPVKHELRQHSATPIDAGMSTPVEHSVQRARSANEVIEQQQGQDQQQALQAQQRQAQEGHSMRARTPDGP